jgi:murein DD-endopeptidase MepM/ murein hydrolase activator NlpD
LKAKAVAVLLVVIAVLGGYGYLKGVIDFNKPKLVFEKKPSSIGSKTEISFKVIDEKPGLKEVDVYLIQGNKTIKILEDRDFPISFKEKEYQISINGRNLGLKNGEAELVFIAKDKSYLQNKEEIHFRVNVDYTPPKIRLIARPPDVRNGGAGFIIFKGLSDDIDSAQVKVGNIFFKCFDNILPNPKVFGCTFAYPYWWKDKKPIVLYVKDKAGNTTTQFIKYRFIRINYKRSIINLTDEFIETKVRPLSDKEIDDPVLLFKYVNVDIRKKNEEVIHSVTKQFSINKPLFTGRFLQLKGSKKLGDFADYRKYRYRGHIIEGADAVHKGMDFASVRNAPVQAAETGKVVFAGFLGIYGNSVIIEHGMGIFTLYSHLAEFNVKKGDMVKKGQEIALTDTTGLAMGDHLHFGVLVQGMEVNPLEWIERRWLPTRFLNIYNRLNKFYGGK